MKTTWSKGPDKGMNSLKLSTSQKAASSNVNMVSNLGNLGATVTKLKPSNNPGPMTSPSAQGPTRKSAK